MTKISWGDNDSRLYESGVDRGVLYLSGYAGVPWNGLVSVAEAPSGGEPKPYYLDGYKYLNVMSAEEYAATIEAYYAPSIFSQCEGVASISNGLFATQQRRKQFNFSYRTMISTDANADLGYKIHIVYNALAGTADRTHKTRSNQAEASTLSWSVTSTPKNISGIRPTAHLIIDSTKANPESVAIVEGYLYGGPGIDPFVPTPEQLLTIFTS